MFSKNKIAFLYESFIEAEAFPKPEPIKKNIPYWFKDLKPHVSDSFPTAKKCIPLLEAMTTGYVITCPVDIKIWTYNDAERNAYCWKAEWSLNIQGSDNQKFEFITSHNTNQVDTLSLVKQGGVPLKFNNFWGIKTPPGYSCLFTSPLNDDTLLNKGLLMLSGIVDTDTYNAPVNFPFIFVAPLNTPVLIERGTPIMQVIPFKRDSWVSDIILDTTNQIKKANQRLASVFVDRYKRLFWSGKNTFN